MKTILLLLTITLVSSHRIKFANDASFFKNGAQLLSSISQTYTKLVSVLTCSKSERIKTMWKNEGFESLDLQGTVKTSAGIMDKFWDAWKQTMIKFNKIPNDLQDSFKLFLDDESESESTTWGKNEIIFDEKSATNELRILNFFINHRDDGKHDAAYTNIRFKFSKAKNTEIWSKSRSFVGGIYSDYKDTIKKTNAELTANDLEDLIDIIRLFSLNFLGNNLGLDLKLPKF